MRFVLLALAAGLPLGAQRVMENLGRGAVAVRTSDAVYVGWRLLGSDPSGIAFNVYRDAERLNAEPLTGTTPDGARYTYSANDGSVGDLDGDGEYEIVLKWEPSNARDNASAGYSGNTILDAYKLDGTRLWRIDLGRNIRAGAHYTQFMVYDLDGDGIAEVAMKTADVTVDGVGTVFGDPEASWVSNSGSTLGKILSGPEYLTVFDGRTGAALATVDYVPPRGELGGWGGVGGNCGNDNTGNRVDRFLAAVAYLDGERPSLVMARGYYGRSVLAAWDWRGGELTLRWVFDSAAPGLSAYSGQGNHNISVADVDGDGKDEIIYGAMVVDHDGHGLYSTGYRHGDALHVGRFDPAREGLLVYGIHENEDTRCSNGPGTALFDAATGEPVWQTDPAKDVGRGLAADIDPRYPGAEFWGGSGGLLNVKGERIGNAPKTANFAAWWDADLLRELVDGTSIYKWDYEKGETRTLLTAEACASNNGTKATPVLSADILGDWREEVIWRTADNRSLRIYTTTIPATNRMPTLMHDPQYRLAIAWQNVGYNQPPHPSFYIGAQ